MPAVSVVLVAHGAWEWTERALAALAASTTVPYEVVLVDNASGDETVARVRSGFPDVRLIENPSNAGFGPGCNQGARAASAPLVCFLNTDALVEPGWFEPLALALGAGVGAAVPCVLELEGSVVQCAGALLGRDGTVLEYGNGLVASDPAVAFARTVDFGPAACMLVSRAAFLEAGGFDDRYAPAYYEDADLCLGLAARGLRTVYVPGSRVRHARYGSGTPSSASALSVRNQERFVARWSGALAGRPASLHPPSEARIACARDALCTGRVLVVADTPPESLLRELLTLRPAARISLTCAHDFPTVETVTFETVAARPGHYDAVFALTHAPRVLGAVVHTPPFDDVPVLLARSGLA